MNKLEQLKEIYAALPTMKCKGLCADDCSVIHASDAEIALVRTKTKAPVKFNVTNPGPRTCPYLTNEGRCGVYDVRPLICRLYGMIDPRDNAMLCRYGCKPTRYLSFGEGQILLKKARDLMGYSGLTPQGSVNVMNAGEAMIFWKEQLSWLEEHNAPHDPKKCASCNALLRNREKAKEILLTLTMAETKA